MSAPFCPGSLSASINAGEGWNPHSHILTGQDTGSVAHPKKYRKQQKEAGGEPEGRNLGGPSQERG